jgi:alkylation response protein AidB-like acyl-CoA dehydrogenase
MSAEHAQLRHALTGHLANTRSPWLALKEAGVVGLRAPEGLGGLGLPVAEAEPVLDVLGDLCLGAPFLETSIIAAGLLACAKTPASQALLARIAEHGVVVAVAGLESMGAERLTAAADGVGWCLEGVARIVIDAGEATALLVLATMPDGQRDGFLVDAGAHGLTLRQVPTIDGRMAADVAFVGVRLLPEARLGLWADAIDAVLDEAVAAVCIEASALMRRLVADTTAYVKGREQFGQPLGAFQVVQHRLVDMNIQARRATAIARRALAALDTHPVVRGRAVSAAKLTICRAGRFVGQNAVQLHGGMGMTEEMPVGRYFKRLTVIEAQLGGADHHLRRFAALAGGV